MSGAPVLQRCQGCLKDFGAAPKLRIKSSPPNMTEQHTKQIRKVAVSMTKRSSRFLPAAAAVAALALASPFVLDGFKTDTSPTALTSGDLSKALSPFSASTAEAAIPVRDGVPT